MEENKPATPNKFSFGTNGGTPEQKVNEAISPVEDNTITDTINTQTVNQEIESEEILSKPYTDRRSVSISLVKNYSLYRKANDKVLPKKREYIGGSVSSSRILSANKAEVEAYFPNIIGLSPNNDDFITRVKGYLNNIRLDIDGLGITFDTSFVYHKKSDYYSIKRQEEEIESDYLAAKGRDLNSLKAAIKDKVTRLNVLESTKHLYGYPVNVEQYLMYRHCLLYNDVAKDPAIINSDPTIRFYFKDDQKEADKLRKYRNEVNKAKVNYVSTLADETLFNAIYTQYLVLNKMPVIAGLMESPIDKELKLDKFSTEEAVKFNKLFANKDSKLIGSIELLIARGELQRSEFNQNISNAEGVFIGSNMGEAVAWFKSPDNISTVNSYYSKLRNI